MKVVLVLILGFVYIRTRSNASVVPSVVSFPAFNTSAVTTEVETVNASSPTVTEHEEHHEEEKDHDHDHQEGHKEATKNTTKEKGHGQKHSHGNHHSESHEFAKLIKESSLAKNDLMDKKALNLLFKRLNETCLTGAKVFESLGVGPGGGLTEEQFKDYSPVVLLHLMSKQPCRTIASNHTSVSARNVLFPSLSMCRGNLSVILEEMSHNGKFKQNPYSKECFAPNTLMDEECTADGEEINLVLMKLVSFMSFGHCILPQPSFFVDEMMESMSTSAGNFTFEIFNNLLSKLGVGSKAKDEKVTEDHDKHAGHVHKRSLGDDHEEHTNRCYSSSDLTSIFGVEKSFFNISSFKKICPAIVQQILSGACKSRGTPKTGVKTTSNSSAVVYTTAMKYGYGTASVLVISLLAFGGLLLFPSIGKTWYKLTIQFFIALGVGTLSGDALLHIIPEVVGLHAHAASDNHGHSDGKAEDLLYVWKLLVVIGGIYVFYLFENVLRLWNTVRGTNLTFHAHDGPPHAHGEGGHGTNHMTSIMNDKCHEGGGAAGDTTNSEDAVDKASDISTASDKPAICCGANTIGIMVFIGDILHNFGDGLAIGVAFSSGWVNGIGTSIAIFCHELPHEFGDFAIYVRNGMSKCKALLFNFLAACCAFIGLYVGLSISQNAEARTWMLAVIAGMFLYISLVDVMHEMVEGETKNPVAQFILQNLGLLLGWAIMLVLSLFEDKIKTSIS